MTFRLRTVCVLAIACAYGRDGYALGFGSVPEGEAIHMGYRAGKRGVSDAGEAHDETFAHAKVDLAILPFPGGAVFWGGPINATRIEALMTFHGNRARAEELRLGLIRWPHVRALSFERNERLGMAFGTEALALELPIPLEGKSSERAYGIAFIGGGLAYKFLHEDARAKAHAHGGSFLFAGRVELMQTIAPRFDLRALFAVNYTGFVGYDQTMSRVRYLQALVFESDVALFFDLGGAPYRETQVRDMDGALREIRRPALGKRWRLALFDVGFELHPIDTMASFGNVAFVKTGLTHEF